MLTCDQLFVDRFSYNFFRPEVGQGFVVRTGNIAGIGQDQYYIKRLVGTPGDTLEVKEPVLLRNGAPITGAEAFDLNANRTGLYHGYQAGGLLAAGQKVTIPDGQYVALCDNSYNSADGRVWGRRKSAMHFEDLQLRPAKDEVWRAVEALLAPEGRACSESTPSVDVKIPRNRELGFGGARVKALHPIIAPGDGYPSLALRLFEPEPVEPAQIVALLSAPALRIGVTLIVTLACDRPRRTCFCHAFESGPYDRSGADVLLQVVLAAAGAHSAAVH